MARQLNAFDDDKLDPAVAKAADRVIELLEEKRANKERLEVQKKNLVGLLKNAGKAQVRHGGYLIKIKHSQKDEVTVKQVKPIDGKRDKGRKA